MSDRYENHKKPSFGWRDKIAALCDERNTKYTYLSKEDDQRLAKENKYARKSLRTRSESTAIERGKAAYLENHANLQQGKTYFSITTKEGVEKYFDFRKRDVELGNIVSGRLATIATHLQHWLGFIGKNTKLKELERTDLRQTLFWGMTAHYRW